MTNCESTPCIGYYCQVDNTPTTMTSTTVTSSGYICFSSLNHGMYTNVVPSDSGVRDHGQDGTDAFIEQHVCTSRCESWDLYLQVIRTEGGTMKRMTMSSLQKILELSIPLTHIRFYELYIPWSFPMYLSFSLLVVSIVKHLHYFRASMQELRKGGSFTTEFWLNCSM
jgi:hypothetical protein